MKDIIIIGSGGLGLEIACLAKDANRKNKEILDLPVLGGISEWVKFKEYEFIIAVGSPRGRKSIVDKMLKNGTPKFSTLIHPNALISEYVEIGEGTIICAGCILTADIKVGKHCIINLNSIIGHEVSMTDFVTIAPMVGIGGTSVISDLVEIGMGSQIREKLSIGHGAVVGMGATVVKNVLEEDVVVGNPAKTIKNKIVG